MKLDLHKLHSYAMLASGAYYYTCDDVLQEQGYENCQVIEVGSSAAYVAWNDSEVVACFRGSDDLVDWVRNLKFVHRVPYAGSNLNGRVHRGFYDSHKEIGFEVANHVKQLVGERDRKITIVGHSLGAAVAAMTAHNYFALHEPEVWLFGCPRIGNYQFTKLYNDTLGSQTYNIRNGNDIVTLSPFWNYPIGEQFYLTPRKVIYWPGVVRRSWERAKATAVWAYDYMTANAVIPVSITDHLITNYANRTRSLTL